MNKSVHVLNKPLKFQHFYSFYTLIFQHFKTYLIPATKSRCMKGLNFSNENTYFLPASELESAHQLHRLAYNWIQLNLHLILKHLTHCL